MWCGVGGEGGMWVGARSRRNGIGAMDLVSNCLQGE